MLPAELCSLKNRISKYHHKNNNWSLMFLLKPCPFGLRKWLDPVVVVWSSTFQKNLQRLDQPTLVIFFAFLKKITTTRFSKSKWTGLQLNTVFLKHILSNYYNFLTIFKKTGHILGPWHSRSESVTLFEGAAGSQTFPGEMTICLGSRRFTFT